MRFPPWYPRTTEDAQKPYGLLANLLSSHRAREGKPDNFLTRPLLRISRDGKVKFFPKQGGVAYYRKRGRS